MQNDSERQLELQNIFEPEINERQRRIAVRYDAMRRLLGKSGRFYDQRDPLILPPPVLYLDPESEQRQRARELRRGQLVFAQRIPSAAVVTLWDAAGREVDHGSFELTIDDVIDPGPGSTVEVRGYQGTLMVGIPIRVTRIDPAPVLYLQPEEEWREEIRRNPRPRTGHLDFGHYIAGAAVVTLRDSAGGEADTFPFQRERDYVVDPGVGGTVELRDRQGYLFQAAVLTREELSFEGVGQAGEPGTQGEE